MYDRVSDEDWQQKLEDRIEKLVGHLLKVDKQRIEYKPQFATPLLEMPPLYGESEAQQMTE